MVLTAPFPAVLINQSILWIGLQQVLEYFQAPVLVYHDGNHHDIDFIVAKLCLTHTVFVAKAPAPLTSEIMMQLVKPQSTVLVLKYPGTVNYNIKKWQLWNAYGKVLVILENQNKALEWLDQLWNTTRAIQVLVMIPRDPPLFFTWFPYRKGECEKVRTVSKLLGTSNLYPPKIIPPFNDCPLRAITSPLPPIVMNERLGIEPRLLLTIAEKLGVKIEYASLPEGQYVWSFVDQDGELKNGMKMLWENDVDVMFSCMSAMIAHEVAEYLPAHFEDTMRWFVPAPKLASKVTSIFRAFSGGIWFLVIISWIGILGVMLMVAIFNSKPKRPVFLNVLAMNLNLPSRISKSQRLLAFIGLAYVYNMHITTMYQSSLMIFLSDNPRERPIETLKDLEDADLDIEMHESQKQIIGDWLTESSAYRTILRPEKLTYTSFLKLERIIAPDKPIAFIGTEVAFGFELKNDETYVDEYGYPRILILKHTVSTVHLIFLISKGHPLVPNMSNYLLHLVDAGMPGYYQREVTRPAPPFVRHIEPFGMDEIEGAFYLYLALLAISLFAWFIELLVHKCSKRNVRRKLRRTKTTILRLINLISRK